MLFDARTALINERVGDAQWQEIQTGKKMITVFIGKGEKMRELIYKQEAIDVLWKAMYEYEDKMEKQFIESDDLDIEEWILHRIFVQNMNDIDRKAILDLPSAEPDVPETNVGKWIKVGDNSYMCSVCGEVSYCNGNFCPDCGADMRERRTDDN